MTIELTYLCKKGKNKGKTYTPHLYTKGSHKGFYVLNKIDNKEQNYELTKHLHEVVKYLKGGYSLRMKPSGLKVPSSLIAPKNITIKIT